MEDSLGLKIEGFLIALLVFVFSISLHEFGHAISADKLGDPTPRRDKRITLWPGSHLDPFGFVFIMITLWTGFGIGWGKPVMVNAGNFRNPRVGMIISSLCGPLMNLALAVVFGLLLRLMIHGHPLGLLALFEQNSVWLKIVLAFVSVNITLMLFNLIPIHPLDGGKILSGLLPRDMSAAYDQFMWTWGPVILLISCFSGAGVLGGLIAPAAQRLFEIIVGI